MEDENFMWKVETWLSFLFEKVGIGSDVEDAHLTWKVETWLCGSVEIVRIGSNIEDAHFMCAFLI